MTTLTRRQAAAHLGKSLATIRRLEGIRLNPRMVNGVYRFDPQEVESLRGESLPEAWGLSPARDGRTRQRREDIGREVAARQRAEHERDELRKALEASKRQLDALRRERDELHESLATATRTLSELVDALE